MRVSEKCNNVQLTINDDWELQKGFTFNAMFSFVRVLLLVLLDPRFSVFMSTPCLQ